MGWWGYGRLTQAIPSQRALIVPWLRDALRRDYRISDLSALDMRECADILVGMMARLAAEARAAEARNALLSWQVISSLAAMFGGSDAEGIDRDEWLGAAGVSREQVETPAEKVARERAEAIATARRLDRFVARSKPAE